MESVWMADWIDVFIGLRFSLRPGWVMAAPIILYSIEVEMLERVQKVYFGSWESYYASQTTRPRDYKPAYAILVVLLSWQSLHDSVIPLIRNSKIP